MASLGILSCALFCASAALGDLVGIPTVPFTTSGRDPFNIHTVKHIVVDSRYANSTDNDGWTLIPPTLWEFASTFREDLVGVTGNRVMLDCESSAAGEDGIIFLTVANSMGFTDAAGRWTSEGYRLDVDEQSVTITGASPLGVWWGTRTILQQAVLGNGKLAAGSGTDSPGWNTRGLFLDGGRHYYPPSFIIEMCTWISYWKQNIFHLHLSDNLYNNVDIYSLERQLELYARFRPLSVDAAVEGLNLHPNESYTQKDFDDIQYGCAARGVTLIPEIESPGHALVISQWKPELGLNGEIDLLNISFPETIPTMKTIWNTFLPWFHSKVVHIGADEYVDPKLSTYQLGELYNTFVNAINSFIRSDSGKSIRIWGTYPPQKNYTNNISKDVVIQHWEFFEDNPLFQYIENGYNVINSDDHFYIVQKWSASYPQHLNRTLIFRGNPSGGAFAPYIFDPNNATNNPARDNPYIPGHIAAQWNDYGYNTSTYLEAYYSWRDLNAALADKQWGGNLTEEQYDAIFEKLQSSAPAQNLDRTIASKTSTILDYDFSLQISHGIVNDWSGNGYNGKTNCSTCRGSVIFEDSCIISSPLASKGRNYTLSFSVLQKSSNPAPLFRGPDSELWSGNGSSTKIMLISAGNAFALNYSLPVGSWTNASLIARGNATFFSVNGGPEMEFTTKIGVNGEYFVWANMAIVAPLAVIGGNDFEGAMKNIKLVDYA
ncbi:glycoside hydrolase family 20 protein [Acidomyces richmondensis BFW]|nr:MAG: glycoside hydrolase family 20 protein [Acidomyces sp. 'richmondensis']KYG43867.1 glycoside hydrolase family 20 protein [Acidomyces richmondensis BFW]